MSASRRRKVLISKNEHPELEGPAFYKETPEDKTVPSDKKIYALLYLRQNEPIPNIISIFDSLQSCLTTIIECYSTRAYWYNSESSSLQINPMKELGIWRKYNVNSEYYKILDNFKKG